MAGKAWRPRSRVAATSSQTLTEALPKLVVAAETLGEETLERLLAESKLRVDGDGVAFSALLDLTRLSHRGAPLLPFMLGEGAAG